MSKKIAKEIETKLAKAKKLYDFLKEHEKTARTYNDSWHEYDELMGEITSLAASQDMPITLPSGKEVKPNKTDYYFDNQFWMSSSELC